GNEDKAEKLSPEASPGRDVNALLASKDAKLKKAIGVAKSLKAVITSKEKEVSALRQQLLLEQQKKEGKEEGALAVGGVQEEEEGALAVDGVQEEEEGARAVDRVQEEETVSALKAELEDLKGEMELLLRQREKEAEELEELQRGGSRAVLQGEDEESQLEKELERLRKQHKAELAEVIKVEQDEREQVARSKKEAEKALQAELGQLKRELQEALAMKQKARVEMELQQARRREGLSMAKELENQVASADRMLRERDDQVEVLQAHMERLTADVKSLEERNEALDVAMRRIVADEEAQAEAYEAQGAEVRQLRDEREHLKDALEVQQKKVLSLEKECHDHAKTTQRSSDDLAKQLEEYKHRAQMALQRANQATQEVTAKCQSLMNETKQKEDERAALLETTQRLRESEAASKQLETELAKARLQVSSHAQEMEAIQRAASELREAAIQQALDRERDRDAEAVRLTADAECGPGPGWVQSPRPKHEKVMPELEVPPVTETQECIHCPMAVHQPHAVAREPSPSPPAPVSAFKPAVPEDLRPPRLALDGNEGEQLHRQSSFHCVALSLDGEEASGGSVGGGAGLFYVTQLEEQRQKDKVELRGLVRELAVTREALDKSRRDRLKLEHMIEHQDLKKRREENLTQGLQVEYLKNCVTRYLSTNDPSLVPVIAEVLKLEKEEVEAIQASRKRR
ncbi:unnamed protein product, partial [Chrysoparadoxa australica]